MSQTTDSGFLRHNFDHLLVMKGVEAAMIFGPDFVHGNMGNDVAREIANHLYQAAKAAESEAPSRYVVGKSTYFVIPFGAHVLVLLMPTGHEGAKSLNRGVRRLVAKPRATVGSMAA